MAISDQLAKAVVKRLEEQLTRLTYHDIVIEVQCETFQCHRFILSACSQYFRDMFSSETGDCAKKVVLENIEIHPDTFGLILECVYGAKENFRDDNVASIWYAAQYLQIDFLCEACESFQSRRLSRDCCVEISINAKRLKAERLLDDARKLMIRELDFLRKRDDLLSLDFEELKLLVSSDDLGAKSEDDVVETILSWTRLHSKKDNTALDTGVVSVNQSSNVITTMLPELLKSARVCLISGTCLHSLLEDTYVLESPDAFNIARETLMYQLQPGRRHDYCPLHAMHRNMSTQQNVTVFISLAASKLYEMSARICNGTWYAMTKPSLQFKGTAVTTCIWFPQAEITIYRDTVYLLVFGLA